ncbi:MAG: nuclear transport factor 2 family protein [Algoriphagus aquaeductus]|uniref:nuclear transport factor 2 family protein n=1 Tax=Algoriphagus aquaeductus TaxID=475299 RepID=UPI00391A7DD5
MLKSLLFILVMLTGLSSGSLAQTSKEDLLHLDKGWENALLRFDVEFLENLVADDFIWVHNHAGLIDGKEAVLSRAMRIQNGQQDDTRNRISRDQQVVILDSTGVVSGYTVVDRGPSPTTYHFMRTYTWTASGWKLLGNHTMAIPEEELK